jgi:hypothetical protein
LRIAIAAFWVVVAVRLPAIVAQLTEPLVIRRAYPSLDQQAVRELADLADQLRIRVLTMDDAIHNQPRLVNLADAVTQLEDILADRETDQCQT